MNRPFNIKSNRNAAHTDRFSMDGCFEENKYYKWRFFPYPSKNDDLKSLLAFFRFASILFSVHYNSKKKHLSIFVAFCSSSVFWWHLQNMVIRNSLFWYTSEHTSALVAVVWEGATHGIYYRYKSSLVGTLPVLPNRNVSVCVCVCVIGP